MWFPVSVGDWSHEGVHGHGCENSLNIAPHETNPPRRLDCDHVGLLLTVAEVALESVGE
jgi:hypothetical protein